MSYKAVAVHKGEYDSFQHHGIRGMKWGVRRYQNEDGSLTAAGKARYSDSGNSFNNSTSISKGDIKKTGSASVRRYTVSSNNPLRQMNSILERESKGKSTNYKTYSEASSKYESKIRDAAASGGKSAVDEYLLREGYSAYGKAGRAYDAYAQAASNPDAPEELKERLRQEAIDACDEARALRDAAEKAGYGEYMPAERAVLDYTPKAEPKKKENSNNQNRRKPSPKGNYTGYAD